jgi:carbon-monoxide dehydrogenase medium subunit
MYPAAFDYERASSVAEALALLADAEGDARVLAGGHGLVPDLKTGEASADVLVDVAGIGRLQGVEADGDGVAVGALATHADVADSAVVAERAPALREAAGHVGDVQIRNRGTVGGNLAEADPAADLPPAVVAADATIQVEGRDGARTVPADGFFSGSGETALAADELVTGVRIPAWSGGAYVKRTHPATGYAMVGVAAVAAVADGTVADTRVAAGGVTDGPVRLGGVEDALVGVEPGDDGGVAAAAAAATGDVPDDRLHGDAYATGEFRREVLPAYVERAVDAALARADGGGSA